MSYFGTLKYWWIILSQSSCIWWNYRFLFSLFDLSRCCFIDHSMGVFCLSWLPPSLIKFFCGAFGFPFFPPLFPPSVLPDFPVALGIIYPRLFGAETAPSSRKVLPWFSSGLNGISLTALYFHSLIWFASLWLRENFLSVFCGCFLRFKCSEGAPWKCWFGLQQQNGKLRNLASLWEWEGAALPSPGCDSPWEYPGKQMREVGLVFIILILPSRLLRASLEFGTHAGSSRQRGCSEPGAQEHTWIHVPFCPWKYK